MQVNMCCGVLILFIVVSWVQSQSTVPFSVSTSNAVNISTESNNNSKDHSSIHTITTATSNSTTSHTKPTDTTTTHTSAPKSNTTTSTSTTNPTTIIANSTSTTKSTTTVATHASAPKPNTTTSTSTTNPTTIIANSTSTTKSTTTVATDTSSPKPNTTTSTSTTNPTTIIANSTSTTKSTTTVATHTSSPKTNVTTSKNTINPTTIIENSTTGSAKSTTTVAADTSSPKTNVTTSKSTTNPTPIIANSTSTTKSTTTVATDTSSPKTNVTTSKNTTNPTTIIENSTTGSAKSTTTVAADTSSPKTNVTTSKSTTNPTTIIANSTTSTTKSTTTVATHTSNSGTMDVTTGTTHKIGLSTTVTATNGHSKVTIKPETSSRTQSPGTTKTTTLATSTVRVTDLGKIYISEVMVGRDVPIMVEFFVTAGTNVSHYTLAVFDDSQNMVQSYHLNQQQDGFLIVTLNNTMLGSETNSVGIALYDTNLWIKKTLNNTYGLVDALVIGTSFQNTSARLIQILTPGCLPIVLQLNPISDSKSITRCSEERACNSSMFMYTSSSFGKNNSAICKKRFNNVDTVTLKFNCSCQVCDDTSINEIIHFLIQEIDKICHCEVTAINIRDSYLACCGGTALHATIFAADIEQKNKMMTAYETLLQSITTVTLGHKNYTISKECGSYCCHQTILPTDSSKYSTESNKSSTESSTSSTDISKTELKTEANVKLRVAVTVTCITVFIVIIIIVVLYRRRKKRGVHQFSMIRLTEEDEDLIMDGVEDDKNVGGQEATFYKIRLGS
ncbi:hypothetical protein ACJMK2_036223 [Sinanodonta woodiana]|uniref:Uncharacterized protein n=1 Tax=Sinanodonta woodiana TaxID=1069815 RepID=A0ABD3WGK4_SINWO